MKYTAQDFAEMIGSFRRQFGGLIRRMSVKLTTGGVWQVAGHLLFDNRREAPPAENYPGIGFSARPPANDSAEAIVVQVGGSNQPAIVATRDEATRAKVADIVVDEAVVYNSVARVYVKADGTIEIRTHGGAAARLALKSDVDAVAAFLKLHFDTALGHTHAGAGAPPIVGTGVGTGFGVPAAAGTNKLKGE